MELTVFLSGEIHTDWRDQIKQACKAEGLDIIFTSAITHHETSDAAGDVLGSEDKSFWRDHKSAKVNAIRIKTLGLSQIMHKLYYLRHYEKESIKLVKTA